MEAEIIRVLEMAWEKFADGEVGAELGEKDYEFEEFVIGEIEKLGGAALWYTGLSHCGLIVKLGGKYYDVDYMAMDVEEIDEETALERASWSGLDEDAIKEIFE